MVQELNISGSLSRLLLIGYFFSKYLLVVSEDNLALTWGSSGLLAAKGTANETPCFSFLEDDRLSDIEERKHEFVDTTELRELKEDFFKTDTRPFPDTIDSQDAWSPDSWLDANISPKLDVLESILAETELDKFASIEDVDGVPRGRENSDAR